MSMKNAATLELPAAGRRHRLWFGGVFAVVLGGMVTALVAFTWPNVPAPEPAFYRFDRAEVEAVTGVGGAYCDHEIGVCLTESGEGQFWAVITDPDHPLYQGMGCTALWRQDIDLSTVGGEGTGAFKDPCHGNVHDRSGGFVSGHHSPFDLTRLPLVVDEGTLTLFTETCSYNDPRCK